MKKMRILSLMLAALMLFSALPAFGILSFAEENSPIRLFLLDSDGIEIDAATGISGVSGDTFTVRIKAAGVDSVCSIDGFQFRLAYNAETLQPVANGASVLLAGDYGTVLYKNGYIQFIWTSPSGTSISKKGKVLAEATFRMVGSGLSELSVIAEAAEGDSLYYAEIEDGDIVMYDYPLVGETSGTRTTCFDTTVSALPNPDTDFCFALNSAPSPINKQAKVGISLHNAPQDLYGFSLEVNYDPAKLCFEGGSFDALFPYGRIYSPEAGRVRVFAATAVNAPATGTTGMALLTFDVIDPDKAVGSAYDLSISYYNNQATYTLDENQNTVSIRTVPTVDTVLTIAPPEYDPFDLNRDADVDVTDVTALLDFIADKRTFPGSVNPDLNGDNDISVTDVSRLLDYIAGVFRLPKNGLYDEDGGVRLYVDGEVQKGFTVLDGKTVYFDPTSGLMLRTNKRFNGTLYICEPFVSGIRVLYSIRQARNGFCAEDGGLRHYVEDVYSTGWMQLDIGNIYFDPQTGLMQTGPKAAVGGVLYVFEACEYQGLTFYPARPAKEGLYEEDGGVRCYAADDMQTGFVTVGGYKLFFDPSNGLMRSDALFVGNDEYFAPEAVSYNGMTVYAYGDPIEEPPVNTAAWAQYISTHGSSVRFPDRKMAAGDLYNVAHTGATGNSPWENVGGQSFRFLITLNTSKFPIRFENGEESPYTWYIWYKDMDGADDDWSLCVTKPDSLVSWNSTSYLFRVPTYAGGMTDLHTNNGARNDYEFVICVYRDSDCSLFCFIDNKNIPVTDAYEMHLADALAASSDMGGAVAALPIDGYQLPSTGVLNLAPDGCAPGVRGGFNPCLEEYTMTAFFDFYQTGVGLDLPDGTMINYTVRRGDGSVVAGSAPLDTSFAPIRTDNGYIGVRFPVEVNPDIYETITFDLSFTDRNGKEYTVSNKSFSNNLPFLGLGEDAFGELRSKGINATVNEKSIVLTGPVGSTTYTFTIQLNKWAGNTKAYQIVNCANLFFDVYPPMYERFGAVGGCPPSVTLAVENEGYGIASTGGNFVHIHDMWLHENPNDYDCLTHEYAHVIQYGWDGNYCEVSGYIEMFADCCRFLYATENGRYNDIGWSIESPGANSTYKDCVRFLVWMDYTYSDENNDLLLKFFTACKNKQYKSSKWAQAWAWIFAGSGLEGKTAAEAFEIFRASEFASLSTKAPNGISPLNARYNVRAKAGRAPYVYALYFPLCNSKGVSNYAATWTATLAGQTWTLENFSNNNSNWSFVKCGTTAGNTSYIRTTLPDAAASFMIDFGAIMAASVGSITLNVYNGNTLLAALPVAIAEGRQTVTIPEEIRAAGLTYELKFVTTQSSVAGPVRLDRILVHTVGYAAAGTGEEEPEINTAAWAKFVSRNGGSERYADFELKSVGLYKVSHSGASEGCAWENSGSPSQLMFLCNVGNSVFNLNTNASPYPFTWTIWYRDADDPGDQFKPCSAKPASTYGFSDSTLFRIPTYAAGMTDLHTDDGERNEYEFIIVFTEDATNRVVCWAKIDVGVTDSYEMFESEQAIL